MNLSAAGLGLPLSYFMNKYVEIAISGPPKKTFTYKLPDSIPSLVKGQRVLVPFGTRNKMGFYLGAKEPERGFKIKEILKPLDNESLFSGELFRFCLWMADYYFANPADCLAAGLPTVYKKNLEPEYYWAETELQGFPLSLDKLYKPKAKLTKSIIEKINLIDKNLFSKLKTDSIVIERWSDKVFTDQKKLHGYSVTSADAFNNFYANDKFQPDLFDGVKQKSELLDDGWTDYRIKKAVTNEILKPVYLENDALLFEFIKGKEDLKTLKLTDEQKTITEELKTKLESGFDVSLIHGVTGSGKTLVYCHLVQEILDKNRTALILTPEIALTSTTLAYFRGFFKEQVTVIHSGMTDKERLLSWQGIKNGKYKIVVGPRSAIFAPLRNLGLIVVDEEHDSSYKQDDPSPRFQGRDAAVMRAKMKNIPIILGSASPSVESYHNAQTNRYTLYELTKRPGKAILPEIKLVDMKTDRIGGDLPYMSFTLKKEIEKRLEKNEQVIIYLNRRGHSTQLKCVNCGHIPDCPNCQVKLTYHKSNRKLLCHYCGYILLEYQSCSKCFKGEYFYQGVGTQKVEENIPRLFEGALALRLDSDTASGRSKAYQILKQFSENKSNMLLGTQMVTKGLDLPGVTLVGVLSADMSLDLPDFRSSEKSFARLLQVAGRSGRAENKGEVIIQTYYPKNEIINDAASQNYEHFFEKEIHSRRQLNYPPFSRIINFILSADNEPAVEKAAMEFRNKLKQKIDFHKVKADILGPAPCPMYYLRKKYRRHLFVKTNQLVKLVKMLSDWEIAQTHFNLPAKVRINIDIDPDNMM